MVVDCRFHATAGTPPEAGVDIEPSTHKPGRRQLVLQNLTFVDLECRGNRGAALSIGLSKLDANESAVAIRVAGATLEGLDGSASELPYNIGLFVAGRSAVAYPASTGWVDLENITVLNTAQPGLELWKQPADVAVALRRCTFAHVGTAPTVRWGGANVPMLLHQSHAAPIGGVVFEDCSVQDGLDRPFLKCDSCDSRGPAVNISGTLTVHNPHGCRAALGAHPDPTVTLRTDCDTFVGMPPGETESDTTSDVRV